MGMFLVDIIKDFMVCMGYIINIKKIECQEKNGYFDIEHGEIWTKTDRL